MPKRPTTRSSGSVFADLSFAPAEAEVLAMRTDLMARLRGAIERKGARIDDGG